MNLNEIGTSSFWRRHANDGVLPVTIVLPTGRARASPNGHIALATDGLNIAEIAVALHRLAERAELEARIRSMLDIDFLENDSQSREQSDDNLVVIGSSGVNVVSTMLLDRTMSEKALGGGFAHPYWEPVIIAGGERYSATNGINMGLVALYRSPFATHERVAILTAGILAVGTVAATRCLVQYLEGRGEGNNLRQPDKPLKIVNGVPRDYTGVPVRRMDQCTPPILIANVTALRVEE